MKTKLYTFLLTLFILLVHIYTYAQQPYTIHLNQNNGLPSNTIYYAYEDSKGFIWLTTDNGLYRYDGMIYKLYQSNTQTSTAGSEIKEDIFGRIWYVNFDGYVYFVENDQLHSLKQNSPLGFVPYGLTENHLFLIQKNGVDVYDLESLKKIKTINITVNNIEFANSTFNNFYFIAENIIYKVDSKFNISKQPYFSTKKDKVKFLYPYNNRIFVVSKYNESGKFYIFTDDLKFEKTVSIPNINFIQRADFVDDYFWIHTPNGTFAYDQEGQPMYKDGLLDNNSCSRVFKDYLSNYWFTTVNNGIVIIPDFNDTFESLENLNPTKFLKTPLGILLGSQNGSFYLKRKGHTNYNKIFSYKEKLPVDYIYYDSINNQTFVADKGFSIINNLNFSSKKEYKSAIKEVVKIDNNYYAIATSSFGGIIKSSKTFKKGTSAWDSIFYSKKDHEFSDMARLHNQVRVKSVAYDSKNQYIYYATNLGLQKVSLTESQEVFNQSATIFAKNIIWLDNKLFILDTKGNILIEKGNNAFELLNKNWKERDERFHIMKTSGEHILLASQEYIYIFTPKTNVIKRLNFKTKDHKINDIILDSNYLLALTDKGVLKLSLTPKANRDRVIFHINHFLVNNKKEVWNEFRRFKYYQNNITINFSILEFSEEKTPFYYRINQGNWILVNKDSREIQFPSLSSGNYFIEFKVGNEISNKKIDFKINTIFWNTWWFYLICSLIGVSLLYLYFHWQYNLMKNQMKLLNDKMILEKSLSKSMLASIKSQMNPHFFYNALNTIQAYIFTNDKLKANTYLSKFSKLTRMILEMSEKENISLKEEIIALELYIELEQMRFTDSFSYEIKLENVLDIEQIHLPPMLIQPYVENAIKHGLLPKEGEKQLSILFIKVNDALIVHIEDNGIGRNKSDEINKIKNSKHQSFSSQANEKRLELLNKGNHNKIALHYIDGTDALGNAIGTTVILNIPI